jgi:hypothetical protein
MDFRAARIALPRCLTEERSIIVIGVSGQNQFSRTGILHTNEYGVKDIFPERETL